MKSIFVVRHRPSTPVTESIVGYGHRPIVGMLLSFHVAPSSRHQH
jgi:hypothetical protein